MSEFAQDPRAALRVAQDRFEGDPAVLVRAPAGDSYDGIISFVRRRRAVRCNFCRARRRIVAGHNGVCARCYPQYAHVVASGIPLIGFARQRAK